MAKTLVDLPSIRQFYDKLNAMIAETHFMMFEKLPKAGTTYVNRTTGRALVRGNTYVPASSGRLKGSLVKPEAIATRGFAFKRAGYRKISFLVRDDTLVDPVFKENYWNKVAYDTHTYFGNINHHREFWKGAAQLLKGNLQTYASQTATLRQRNMFDSIEQDMYKTSDMEKDLTFWSLYDQAQEEDN